MISTATAFLKHKKINAEDFVFLCFVGVFLTMPVGTAPPTIFGALALVLWLFSGKVLKVRSFFHQSWFWPVIAFIILPWMGLLYAPDSGGFTISYAKKTYYWLFCLALASLSFETLEPRKLIHAFLFGVALNACVGILQVVGVIAPKQGWFSGLTRGYNTVSVYLILAILVCSFYYRDTEEVRKQTGLVGLMILYFFHLIFMESRTGYLTFIILFPFMLKILFRKIIVWKLAIVCMIIIGAMFLSPVVKKRVALTVSQLKYHLNAEPNKAWGKEYTVQQDRFYMWHIAVQIFLENPIIGVGTGGYSAVVKERGKADDPTIAHPHSNILYMAVSYGVIGLLAFVWFFGELFRNALRQRETALGHFILCAALVLFINGLFNTTILDAGTLLLLSPVVGLQRSLSDFREGGQPSCLKPA